MEEILGCFNGYVYGPQRSVVFNEWHKKRFLGGPSFWHAHRYFQGEKRARHIQTLSCTILFSTNDEPDDLKNQYIKSICFLTP